MTTETPPDWVLVEAANRCTSMKYKLSLISVGQILVTPVLRRLGVMEVDLADE